MFHENTSDGSIHVFLSIRYQQHLILYRQRRGVPADRQPAGGGERGGVRGGAATGSKLDLARNSYVPLVRGVVRL